MNKKKNCNCWGNLNYLPINRGVFSFYSQDWRRPYCPLRSPRPNWAAVPARWFTILHNKQSPGGKKSPGKPRYEKTRLSCFWDPDILHAGVSPSGLTSPRGSLPNVWFTSCRKSVDKSAAEASGSTTDTQTHPRLKPQTWILTCSRGHYGRLWCFYLNYLVN